MMDYPQLACLINDVPHLVTDDLEALQNGRLQRVGAAPQPHLHCQHLLLVCLEVQGLLGKRRNLWVGGWRA